MNSSAADLTKIDHIKHKAREYVREALNRTPPRTVCIALAILKQMTTLDVDIICAAMNINGNVAEVAPTCPKECKEITWDQFQRRKLMYLVNDTRTSRMFGYANRVLSKIKEQSPRIYADLNSRYACYIRFERRERELHSFLDAKFGGCYIYIMECLGGVIYFYFNEDHNVEMQVLEAIRRNFPDLQA